MGQIGRDDCIREQRERGSKGRDVRPRNRFRTDNCTERSGQWHEIREGPRSCAELRCAWAVSPEARKQNRELMQPCERRAGERRQRRLENAPQRDKLGKGAKEFEWRRKDCVEREVWPRLGHCETGPVEESATREEQQNLGGLSRGEKARPQEFRNLARLGAATEGKRLAPDHALVRGRRVNGGGDRRGAGGTGGGPRRWGSRSAGLGRARPGRLRVLAVGKRGRWPAGLPGGGKRGSAHPHS